jgi:hypothetical protein
MIGPPLSGRRQNAETDLQAQRNGRAGRRKLGAHSLRATSAGVVGFAEQRIEYAGTKCRGDLAAM